MHSTARTQRYRMETAQSLQEIRLEGKSPELSCGLMTTLTHHTILSLDEFTIYFVLSPIMLLLLLCPNLNLP